MFVKPITMQEKVEVLKEFFTTVTKLKTDRLTNRENKK